MDNLKIEGGGGINFGLIVYLFWPFKEIFLVILIILALGI